MKLKQILNFAKKICLIYLSVCELVKSISLHYYDLGHGYFMNTLNIYPEKDFFLETGKSDALLHVALPLFFFPTLQL